MQHHTAKFSLIAVRFSASSTFTNANALRSMNLFYCKAGGSIGNCISVFTASLRQIICNTSVTIFSYKIKIGGISLWVTLIFHSTCFRSENVMAPIPTFCALRLQHIPVSAIRIMPLIIIKKFRDCIEWNSFMPGRNTRVQVQIRLRFKLCCRTLY